MPLSRVSVPRALRRTSAGVALAVFALMPVEAARAQAGGECHVVEVEMTPSDDLQIVVWIEDADGNYVDTVYLTRSIGTYGLGNRPGMPEFNSAYHWPYGRRLSTFPVWAHRHGMTWPLIVFQNWKSGDPLDYTVEDPTPATTPEENLSHPLANSSPESYYCRPLAESEPAWDAESCATTPGVFTDKGRFHPSLTSLYPPRSDLVTTAEADSADAAEFATLNPFDAVSRATPEGGRDMVASWRIPDDLPNGDYVAWVEVSKEQDQNQFYDQVPYSEADLMWGQYGVPYLGQPSVVYEVPFTISDQPMTVASVTDYAGYGDPDGLDGNIRPPDATISTDVPGSGASRLMLVDDGGDMHRVQVTAFNEKDQIPPGLPVGLTAVDVTLNSAALTFTATGDDGDDGQAQSYEVRYLAGEPITEDNFETGTLLSSAVQSVAAGLQIDVELTGLLPRTNYYVGVRAVDNCLNAGPVASVRVTTPIPRGGEVDACFVATAAYGSFMANQVTDLRRFRDSFLRSNVPGELFVEAYYTFGPALARAIAPSELGRALARQALAPLVDFARHMSRRWGR